MEAIVYALWRNLPFPATSHLRDCLPINTQDRSYDLGVGTQILGFKIYFSEHSSEEEYN